MRLRLTLWIAIIFTLILWVTAGVFWLYQRSSINTIFNDMLSQRGATLAEEIAEQLPGLDRAQLDALANEAVREIEFERILIDVYTPSGEHAVPGSPGLVDSASLPLEEALEQSLPILIPDPEWASHVQWPDESGTRAVVIGLNAIQDRLPYVLLVATTDRFALEQLAIVRGVLLTAISIAPLMGLLSGWFIAGIAVAPFFRLQDLAKQLGPESLGKSLVFEPGSSEVAELASQLDEARSRIQEAFAAQERFISNVSHEIKTPIAVMLVESQTLDLTGLPDEVGYFVGSVQEEMSRLGKLVESFLTLTRIEDGHSRIRGKRYAANDLAMDAVEQCAVMANQANVWLRPRLFADEETIDIAVAGEPELLRNMLDNLIRNAIKFSPTGAGIEIVLLHDDEHVEFAIRDEGPGIPPEKLATIFDRFSQAGGSERKGRGHGLGLAIAKGIAELHGGTVTAQNRDVGCEFKITLPRSPAGG